MYRQIDFIGIYILYVYILYVYIYIYIKIAKKIKEIVIIKSAKWMY